MSEELKIIITAEMDKLKKGMDDAKKQIKSFGDKMKDVMSKAMDVTKKTASSIGKGLVTGIKTGIDAFGKLSASIVATVELTKEMRDNQAKLVSAFESAGSSAEQAKQTYSELYRVLGDNGQAVEASNHLAKLTQDQQALSEWTKICEGVYATFGESLPIEGLTEASNETAKVGQVTGSLADALNWAGVSEDEFNKKLEACNSEAEREKLIRETLNGLYEESANKFEENNKAVLEANEAQAKLNDNLGKVGDALQPVITFFKNLASEALELVIPYIQELVNEYLPMLQENFGSVEEIIGKAKDKFVEIKDKMVEWKDSLVDGIEEVNQWIEDHKTQLELLAIAIGGLTTALIIYNGAKILSAVASGAETVAIGALIVAEGLHTAVATVATGVTTAFGAAMAFLTSPITLVVLAITALIAIIYLLIKNWDSVKEFGLKCWDAICKGVQTAISAIGKWLNSLWQNIVTIFNNIKQWIVNKFTEAKTGVENAFSALKSFFSGIWNFIKGVFNGVGSWFGNIFNNAVSSIRSAFSSIVGFFSGIWNSIKSIFSNVGTAIANGIKGAVSSAVNKVLSTACRIINGFIGAINVAIGVINAIPGVSVGKLSKLSVPKMATGGIVDSATLALIGEGSQSEAVVPLDTFYDKLGEMFEQQNRMLAQNTQGNATIILQMDGKEVARGTANNMKEMAKLGQLDMTWL